MQITWSEDNNLHYGSAAGNTWFSIRTSAWVPFLLSSAIPVPMNLSDPVCNTVQEAQDKAAAILAAFLELVAPGN